MTVDAPFKVGEWHGAELYRVSEDMFDWLRDTCGDDGERWFLRSNWIYFRDPRDHMMFLLRYQ